MPSQWPKRHGVLPYRDAQQSNPPHSVEERQLMIRRYIPSELPVGATRRAFRKNFIFSWSSNPGHGSYDGAARYAPCKKASASFEMPRLTYFPGCACDASAMARASDSRSATVAGQPVARASSSPARDREVVMAGRASAINQT